MSVFCPKCGKRTYNEYNCDHCMHEIKKNNIKKENITINKNKIITIAIIVIAISVSYLAINKFTEDTPQEKLLKSLYGTSDIKEIEKINKIETEKLLHSIEKTTKAITNEISNVKPSTINLSNTYKSKMQEEERKRQLEIQRKQRELQRLQKESEEAKRKLKAQMQMQIQ